MNEDTKRAFAALGEQMADMRTAIDGLCVAVEPICGFKPESRAQAISLLATHLLNLVPALEALRQLACVMDDEDKGNDWC